MFTRSNILRPYKAPATTWPTENSHMTSLLRPFKSLSWTSKGTSCSVVPSQFRQTKDNSGVTMFAASFLMCLLAVFLPVCRAYYAPDEVSVLPGMSFKPNFRQWSGYLQARPGKFLHYWCVLLLPCTSQVFLPGVNCPGRLFALVPLGTISGTSELCSDQRLRYLLQVCDVTEGATRRSPGALAERWPRLQLARWLSVGERTVSRKGWDQLCSSRMSVNLDVNWGSPCRCTMMGPRSTRTHSAGTRLPMCCTWSHLQVLATPTLMTKTMGLMMIRWVQWLVAPPPPPENQCDKANMLPPFFR